MNEWYWALLLIVVIVVIIGLQKRGEVDLRMNVYQCAWALTVVGIFVLLTACTYAYRREAMPFPMRLGNIVDNYLPGLVAVAIGYFTVRTRKLSGQLLMLGGTLWTMLMACLMCFH